MRSGRKGGHWRRQSGARQAATRASSFGKKAVVCALISARSSERPGHGGMEFDRRLDQSFEPSLRTSDPKLGRGVRAVAPGVLADRLSEFARVAEHIAEIVGHLIGFAQRVAEPAPWFGIGPCGCRARERRSDEEGAGLGALIVGERDGGFAFPCLPRDDAAGRPNRRRYDGDKPRQPARLGPNLTRQHIERHDNQRIPGQHRDWRAEASMNGRLAAPGVGVVETGQIVVDERGAMQEFDRRGGGRGCGRMRVAAGRRDREAELGPDPMSARKDRVVEGRREQRRRPGALRETNRALQSLFDALRRLHGSLPPFVRLTCRLYMSIYIDTSLREPATGPIGGSIWRRDGWSSSAREWGAWPRPRCFPRAGSVLLSLRLRIGPGARCGRSRRAACRSTPGPRCSRCRGRSSKFSMTPARPSPRRSR